MSYDISLLDPVTNETILLDSPHQMKGAIYAIGGDYRAKLSVTFNYSKLFDFKGLNGKLGAESITVLKNAIAKLNDDATDDYWEPTEGNCKKSLFQLLALASLRPDGVWQVGC